MCGIAGMVGSKANLEIVKQMATVQHHRGPDGEGTWSAKGVALGHRRLKIIDLSDAGQQPMSIGGGRYTIVFNGEVYNYRELRREMPDIEFRSQTDTEVVLNAYAKWGPSCLEKFIGMFALAIWDNQDHTLFCARDRLGIKPFYYTFHQGTFCFSSEIRGLLVVGVPRVVNEGILYDFLARDFYDHTTESFFEGINQLPPGHWVIVRDGNMGSPKKYWDLEEQVGQQNICSDPQTRETTLLELYHDAIDLHLRSDVPVGVALSGGLDSATLLSLLDQIHPDPTRVEAFSFSFADPAYSEKPWIEEMARHTGRQAHFAEVSSKDFTDTAERFCYEQEEPYAGLPISAYSLCFQMARQNGFIVMMDGSGIDEGLAGYQRFRPAYWADLFQMGNWQVLEQELISSGISTPNQRRIALSQMFSAMQPQADIGKGQDLTNSVRPDCLSKDFSQSDNFQQPVFDHPFPDYLRNLMYRELRYTKLPRALRFRDRLSMAVSTELRPPFLDHRLLAYEFALPATDYIYQGSSKAILRRAAARLAPEAVRMASKRSVQTPQREWFRTELKNWVREHIDTPRFWQRGWVERTNGLAAMEAFFKGEGDNSFFLWQWINLEIWAEQYIDAFTPSNFK